MPAQQECILEKNIIFIRLPEHLGTEINGFYVNPEIPLPVEKSEKMEEGSLKDLSWEMIVSAMLKILAHDREFEHIEYYRAFVNAVKPDLIYQLTDAGIVKARQNDFVTAEEIFLAIEGLDSDNIINLINLALIYEQQGEKIKDRNPSESDEYFNKAFNYYKKALLIDPGNADLHYSAACFFLGQNNYEKAKHHFSTYSVLAEPETDEEREKAAKAQRIADSINTSTELDTLFKESYDLIKLGNEKDGIEKIRKFLDSYPDVWNAWFLLGWGLRRTGSYEEALTAFNKVIELGERSVDTLNELAICNLELDKLKESEDLLKEALTIEHENTKIISNLGIVAMKKGNLDEAEGFFHTVLEYDSSDPAAKQYIDQIKNMKK